MRLTRGGWVDIFEFEFDLINSTIDQSIPKKSKARSDIKSSSIKEKEVDDAVGWVKNKSIFSTESKSLGYSTVQILCAPS